MVGIGSCMLLVLKWNKMSSEFCKPRFEERQLVQTIVVLYRNNKDSLWTT